MGGTKKPDFNATLERGVEHSLILVSNDPSVKRILAKRTLPYPAVHSAAALYNKKHLFIAGGRFKEQWSPGIYSIDIVKAFSKDQKAVATELSDMPEAVYGPSMTIPNGPEFMIYVAGASLLNGHTKVFKYQND